MKFSRLLLFLFFASATSVAWDGYDENNLNNIYINPSERIEAGNTVSFFEKSRHPLAKKRKILIERTSSSYFYPVDKIYGYVDGEFVVFKCLHD